MAEETATDAATQEQFPCEQCGADLKFKPGARALECPYCGHENPVPAVEDFSPEELDFRATLENAAANAGAIDQTTVKCTSCGASATLDPNIVSDACPFCGSAIVSKPQTDRLIAPQSLLPFKVESKTAKKQFRDWVKTRWFAPNDLKKLARHDERLQGVYIPYWTYDCRAFTRYTGMRGEHYWVTETYTTTEDGKTVTKTRQVRKTRWYPTSGSVRDTFDDVLVLASESLPAKLADALEPWDLDNLVAYDNAYLAGFRAESYRVDLKQGFDVARDKMDPEIRNTIRRDIGGDEQRILTKQTRYDDVTFKHLLLPVWISAYRYKDDIYRFMVNARTGEVQGERPWSWIKITLAVVAGLAVAGGIAYVAHYYA